MILQRSLIAASLVLATAAYGAPPPVQAELFQRQHPDTRADGFRAAGRVPGLGVLQFDYTRTQLDAPDASRVTALEWRPPWAGSSGFAMRAVERREGDARTRTLEMGWSFRF